MRSLRKRHRPNKDFTPFKDEEIYEAIKHSSNSTATGPDGITSLHLKHLGPKGKAYLTRLFNLSVSRADIPAIWKSANVIPILKPGKPANQSTSYRPISLLCPAIKVLERLILPYITEALPPSESQHGFRPFRSTSTALLPIVNEIAMGFNQKKPASRTATVALDIAKAFDSVDHVVLLEKIAGSALNPNIVRWLACWLRGRTAACIFQCAKSPQRIIHTGVPQGSVLSPAIFNFFVSDCPAVAQLTSSFADDFTACESSPDLGTLTSNLQTDMDRISLWATNNQLTVAPNKSQITLFTPHTHQSNHHPQVLINGTPIPLEKCPKILGLVLDTHFTFSPHIAAIAAKASKRLQIMKALAGTTWGQSKETLLLTFKTLIQPVINYAAPTWFPNAKPSSISKLQAVQNAALRIATGCHKMSSIQHLHSESNVLPVANHLRLLCTQFLANAMRPLHPSHAVVSSPPGPRRMKETLQSKFGPALHPFLLNGVIPNASYKKVIQTLHTDAVTSSISSLGPNSVLGVTPPQINANERDLPRPT